MQRLPSTRAKDILDPERLKAESTVSRQSPHRGLGVKTVSTAADPGRSRIPIAWLEASEAQAVGSFKCAIGETPRAPM
jgi:hypothetical protein